MKVLISILLLSILATSVTGRSCAWGIQGCLNCDDADMNEVCNMCVAGTKLTFNSEEGFICQLCEEGKGKSSDTEIQTADGVCTVDCPTGCYTCDGTGTKCLLCKAGYFLNAATNTCLVCTGGKGSTLINQITKLGLDSLCDLTCPSNCDNCVNNGFINQCVACKLGYYLNGSNRCLRCQDGTGKAPDIPFNTVPDTGCPTACTVEGCIFCGENPGECLQCDSGYAFSQELKTCTKCARGFTTPSSILGSGQSTSCSIKCKSQCADCLSSATNCVGCAAGYFYDSDEEECLACPAGTGRPADTSRPTETTTCAACTAPCEFCGAPTECLGCKAHYKLNFQAKTCSTCPQGFTSGADSAMLTSDGICEIPCNHGCKFCEGEPQICTGCHAGFSFDFDTKTCNACTYLKGIAADIAPRTTSSTCGVDCDLSCWVCTDVPTDCVACPGNQYLDFEQKKCFTCNRPGFTRGIDDIPLVASSICDVPCEAGCSLCYRAPFICRGCFAGFKLVAGTGDYDGLDVCTPCESGKGRAQDTEPTSSPTTCDIPCEAPCSYCTGVATECVGCTAGYRLLHHSKTCTRCTGGSGKAVDTVPQTQDTVCNIECQYGCESCLGTPTECIRCDHGHWWDSNSACQKCPLGYGKPRDLVDKSTAGSMDGSQAGECIECDGSCTNCKGPLETDCLGCRAGYRGNGLNSCQLCSGSNFGNNRLTYTKAPASPQCHRTCHASCSSCSGGLATNCLACVAGYYWDGTGACIRCDEFTGRPEDSTIQSTALTQQTGCFDCHANCRRCFGRSESECSSCRAGFKLTGSTCTRCESGKTKTADTDSATPATTCGVNCNEACTACTGADPNQCTICQNGFYKSAATTCSKCPQGFGILNDPNTPTSITDNSACNIQCHPSCAICYGPESYQCVACNGGFYWSGNGVCTACPSGEGSTTGTSVMIGLQAVTPGDVCDWCTASSNCEICGDDIDVCIYCKAGYYRNAQGACTLCPTGKGKPADFELTVGSQACYITCHSSCLTCSGDSSADCTSCPAGRYLSATGICSLCPLGRGSVDDTAAPSDVELPEDACTIPCYYGCYTCSGTTDANCLVCRGGFYRSGPSSCSECPAGFGSLNQETFPAVSTSQGADECTIPCQAGCKTCKDRSESGCIMCKASYHFGPVGQCTLCSANAGKDADATPLYEVPAETGCSSCAPPCLSCTGINNVCTRCGAGQFLKSDNTCAYCENGKGKAADSVPGPPSTDPNGTDVCTTCDTSCNYCSDGTPQGCLSCAPNYRWTGATGTCVACGDGKTKPRDTAIKFGSSTADTCITCSFKCAQCQDTADNCLYCGAAYFNNPNSVCTLCDSYRGKPADTEAVPAGIESDSCIGCHSTCEHCSGQEANQCLHCIHAHYLSAAGVCSMCSPGSGRAAIPWFPGDPWMPVTTSEQACNLNCHPECSSCSVASDATRCVGCAAGRYLSISGTCAQCGPGSGKPADTSLPTAVETSAEACTACHPSCVLCKGTGANDCLICAAGYYPSGPHTCSLCSGGFGKAANTLPVTELASFSADLWCEIPCHASCGTCTGTGENECINCAAGHYWIGNGRCTKCNERSGKPADTEAKTTAEASDVCTTECDDSCLICRGTPSSCLMCSAGYFYSSANVCTMCPEGSGKLKDGDIPTSPSTTSGATECNIPCHGSCRTCIDTTATTCLNCAAGFYFTGEGTCTGCEVTKGKPADTVIYTSPQEATSCSACHASCNKCKGTGASDCLNCNDGFYLSAAGTCSECPVNSGSVKALPDVFDYPTPNTDATLSCTIPCAYPCANCVGTTTADCLYCREGHFLSAVRTCELCPAGSGKGPDSANTAAITSSLQACSACAPGCAQCSDTSICISCLPGWYFDVGDTCSPCPYGFGGPGSPLNGQPVIETAGCSAKCHTNCIACSGPGVNECLSCKAGTYLSAQGSCDLCPFGKGKPEDVLDPVRSTTGGVDECTFTCHETCRTCSEDNLDTACLNCRAGHFFQNGACTQCPDGKGKPADTDFPTEPQTEDICSATCHSSCFTCAGSREDECASCGAGHYWSGASSGVIQKCNVCPKSRGKTDDSLNRFPTTAGSANDCTTYCDLCDAGCLTCSGNSADCIKCVDRKYLTAEKTCEDCAENCLKCTDATKCDACDEGFELTTDGQKCLKCQVMNCETCTSDPFKCTKCADKFTLKSDTECVYEPKQQPLALNLSTVSIAETPQLAMNILENTLEVPFAARESANFVAITLEDQDEQKIYSCADVHCTYSVKNERLKFEFDTDIMVKKGKLRIDRGADAKKPSIVGASSHKQSRLLQELANYPITIDGISLMRKSQLSTAAFATRVIVGILRLPLSLLVFWRFPHLAMMMDTMVTHLKVYSLMSQPYLAYVEVVFQSVSDSKVLPFNFNNPFEGWNPDTLQCGGFVGLRNRNMHCSFFDNYGENIIGLVSVALTCLILMLLSKKMLQNSHISASPRNFWQIIFTSYGLDFFLSKIDANHLEIALMTLVAYSTADHSSKSVIGIIFGTCVLIAFGFVARHVTNAVRRNYEPSTSSATNGKPSAVSGFDQPELASDIALDNQIANFVVNKSTTPTSRGSVFFFAARYIRALLLVIFVATVRDPVDQIILIVILESVYLVALILLEFRGSRLERFFNIGMHGVILAHLICRAVATSKKISEDQLQSSLASAIVVFLFIYVFAHVLASIAVLIGIFMKDSTKQHQPVNASSTKIEMNENPKPEDIHQQSPDQPHIGSSPVSFYDMPVPPEFEDKARGQSVHERNSDSNQQHQKDAPVSKMDFAMSSQNHNNNEGFPEKQQPVSPPQSFQDLDIPQE